MIVISETAQIKIVRFRSSHTTCYAVEHGSVAVYIPIYCIELFMYCSHGYWYPYWWCQLWKHKDFMVRVSSSSRRFITKNLHYSWSWFGWLTLLFACTYLHRRYCTIIGGTSKETSRKIPAFNKYCTPKNLIINLNCFPDLHQGYENRKQEN